MNQRGAEHGREAGAKDSPRSGRPRVTVLVDNNLAVEGLARQHGLSLWIEVGDARVLLDTGEDDAFARNAAALGVELSTADAVTLSHGHYDHSGGLPVALRAAPHARLSLHPAALQNRYLRHAHKRPEPIGLPAASREAILAASDRATWCDGPSEVVPGLWCTGTVPRDLEREPGDPDFFFDSACTMPDPVPDDVSFWIDTPDGLWIILGCAHSGVLATLEYVDRLTGGRPLVALIGGTHLVDAPAQRVAMVIDDLRRRAPSVFAPCHCTGSSATAAFKLALPDAFVPLGSGAVLE